MSILGGSGYGVLAQQIDIRNLNAISEETRHAWTNDELADETARSFNSRAPTCARNQLEPQRSTRRQQRHAR